MGQVREGTRWRWEGSPCPPGNRLAWSPRNIRPGFVGQWHRETVGDFSAQGTLHFKSFVRIVFIYFWGILVHTFFRIVCFILAFWE